LGVIDNCFFRHNQTGIVADSWNTIKNSIIDSNAVEGVRLEFNGSDSLFNCEIKHNGIGVNDLSTHSPDYKVITKNIIDSNSVGIKLGNYSTYIFCNRICSNTTYDLQYTVAFGSNTIVPNNYWCTPDSLSTTARIYDGYDNISLGLVNFMPIDTTQCYLLLSLNNFSDNSHDEIFTSTLFPNPFTTHATIKFPSAIHSATFRLYNLYGQLITETSGITGESFRINAEGFRSGVYVYEVTEKEKKICGGKAVVY
jgi:hypothetical protein